MDLSTYNNQKQRATFHSRYVIAFQISFSICEKHSIPREIRKMEEIMYFYFHLTAIYVFLMTKGGSDTNLTQQDYDSQDQ